MKTWGIVTGAIGIGLFIWHLTRVQFNPDYQGYASHQVMAINAIVLLLFGMAVYFLGRWRKKKRGRPNA